MVSFDKMFAFVLSMSKKFSIDTSHSERHSMDVLHFAHAIYKHEVNNFPFLKKQENIIYSAAILHDMCDRKYVTPEEGLKHIEDFLEEDMTPADLHYTSRIIDTMSYSKVKKQGYPDLGDFTIGYHVVREADLLASYDFDRAITYNMHQGNNLTHSYYNSLELFEDRVFNYHNDKLLLSEYSQMVSVPLTIKATNRMQAWQKILRRV
jgi:hypothetical protein